MSLSMQAEPFVPVGFTSADFPDVEMAILPKEKAKHTCELDQCQ